MSSAPPRRFPVVGVGASAGGLESLRRMLQGMPAEPPFALVIVHHLARDKPSLASELLAKYTQMPVRQVAGEPLVQPGHVYVIPPGKFLSIEAGRLRLTPMQGPRQAPTAIDFFFHALAKDQGECAVGVILSGTGSDGTLGVKAIKESGGLVLAQEASTADHSGMPESAIGTGIVDQILAPEAMPGVLAQFAVHDYISGDPSLEHSDPSGAAEHAVSPREVSESGADPSGSEPTQGAVDDSLDSIISLLRTQCKRDFRNYKLATLSRRTRRRMCLHHIDRYDDYLEFLKVHPDEVRLLGKDLLISTNEELETSKEELQSLNEELSTVNQQLEGKVEELEIKHADLGNLIAATEVATICLAADLSIRWFTPAARDLIRIQPADVGRPLQDLQNDFLSNDLMQECEQVLQQLVPTDREVDCTRSRTFIRRIVPYRSASRRADSHGVGGVVITLVDITARRIREEKLKKSEADLRELTKTLEQQVAQRTELLNILQFVTRLANEARSVDEALQAAMARLAQFNDWRVGHVWRRVEQNKSSAGSHDPAARWISTALWHVDDEFRQRQTGLAEFQQLTEQMSVDSGENIIDEVLETGDARQVGDLTRSSSARRAKVPGLNLHAAIAFPITIDGEIVAIMEFFAEQPGKPDPAFLEIMPDIGIQLGHVIARKRLEQIVAEIASEEQQRIGRELHDGIAQQLTGGALIAESLRRSLSANSTTQIQSADHLIEIFQETHDDVSRLSQGLLPDAIRPADLSPSLAALVDESQERFGLDITLDVDRFDKTFVLTEVVATTIYQIARESLHNAIKHSGGASIAIELSTSDRFEMLVRDHGGGFETSNIKPKRNGLRIMRYRAEAIGGELRLRSAAGEGTLVTLIIPKNRCQS